MCESLDNFICFHLLKKLCSLKVFIHFVFPEGYFLLEIVETTFYEEIFRPGFCTSRASWPKKTGDWTIQKSVPQTFLSDSVLFTWILIVSVTRKTFHGQWESAWFMFTCKCKKASKCCCCLERSVLNFQSTCLSQLLRYFARVFK